MPETTKNLRDIVANLRHIANLLDGAEVGELVAPVRVQVKIQPVGGDQAALIDQVASVTGSAGAFDDERGSHAFYRTVLAAEEQTWSLEAYAYLSRPDPAEALKAENEQLRKALGKIKKIASKHTGVDGCACEDCEELTSDG